MFFTRSRSAAFFAVMVCIAGGVAAPITVSQVVNAFREELQLCETFDLFFGGKPTKEEYAAQLEELSTLGNHLYNGTGFVYTGEEARALLKPVAPLCTKILARFSTVQEYAGEGARKRREAGEEFEADDIRNR
jgi:hypothetical protein